MVAHCPTSSPVFWAWAGGRACLPPPVPSVTLPFMCPDLCGAPPFMYRHICSAEVLVPTRAWEQASCVRPCRLGCLSGSPGGQLHSDPAHALASLPGWETAEGPWEGPGLGVVLCSGSWVAAQGQTEDLWWEQVVVSPAGQQQGGPDNLLGEAGGLEVTWGGEVADVILSILGV